MALDSRYVPLYQLQQYFVDKTTGAPLSNGYVFFYSDINRTTFKTVYELTSTIGTYTYTPLPNPVRLSNVGTPTDAAGNDIVIYAYPFDAQGEEELYYVVVQDSNFSQQFTREAVPGPQAGANQPTNIFDTFNYIPNGQFLAHTDVPENTLVAGSNVIAQGGWSVELSNPLFSNNMLTFETLDYTNNPTESPRYAVNLTAVTFSGSDTIKNLRIKFFDVNKFSATNDFYTFAFWAQSNVSIPVSIQVVKFFGTNGSVVPPITVATDTITTTGEFFQFQFQFGLNSGYTLDTVNNNDYVAIDIAFPVNIGFAVAVTDAVLAAGTVVLDGFPLQTNADMLTRGVAGWMNEPDVTGLDLYLPPVLTRQGMMFDRSIIGKIEMATRVFPIATDPSLVESDSNNMPCDGHSYYSDQYSTIGIPFSRLADYLIQYSPVPGVPLYGTGADFATAYLLAGQDSDMRLTVNMSGAGSSGATDGSTGWTIGSIVTYGGSTTGSNSIGYNAYNNVADTVLAVGTWGDANFNSAPTPGTTPFTVTVNNNFTGLTAQFDRSFTVLCTAASTIVAGSSNPGDYWLFSSDSIDYYMWFYFNGETDPTIGGRTGIRVDLKSTYTAQDVANIVREAMNAYQISIITPTGLPLQGQYWLFSTNPGAVINYYVWYQIDGIGVDPSIAGRIGILVSLLSSDTVATTVIKTQLAIDAFKFAAPDFRGMFPRGYDPTGIYDLDVAQRWSTVSGLSGANLGTYEYQQLLSHNHANVLFLNLGSSTPTAGAFFVGQQDNTANTGGTETRPVNFYTQFVIRY